MQTLWRIERLTRLTSLRCGVLEELVVTCQAILCGGVGELIFVPPSALLAPHHL
jgi:hypothetical protein